MSHANFYRHGDPNYQCDRCGFKYKRSQMKKEWNGYMVCPYDYEIRHPQDFLKSRPDRQTIPDPRPGDSSSFFTASAQSAESTDASIPNDTDTFLDTNEVTVDDL